MYKRKIFFYFPRKKRRICTTKRLDLPLVKVLRGTSKTSAFYAVLFRQIRCMLSDLCLTRPARFESAFSEAMATPERFGALTNHELQFHGTYHLYTVLFYGELIRGRKYDFTKRRRSMGEVLNRVVQYMGANPTVWVEIKMIARVIIRFLRSVVITRRNHREMGFWYAYGLLRHKVCMQEVALFLGLPETIKIV